MTPDSSSRGPGRPREIPPPRAFFTRFEPELFERAEKARKKLGLTQREFYERAVRHYLDELERRQ